MADIENLFPIVFCVLDRYWAQMTVCVNLFSMLFHQKGEHFLEKSRLYPSADRTWGTILKKTSAVPKNRRNLKKTWGTNHKKASAVPNPPTPGNRHHHERSHAPGNEVSQKSCRKCGSPINSTTFIQQILSISGDVNLFRSNDLISGLTAVTPYPL